MNETEKIRLEDVHTFDDLLKSDIKIDGEYIKLDEDQKKAIRADKATIVSAGAGSGKTTVLSLRFVKLLLDNDVDPDEILTLTFTKKAASEMYGRIVSLVKDIPTLSEKLRKFPESNISTLDAFWQEIARTNPMKYGFTRDFELLEDCEEERIRNSIVASLAVSHKSAMQTILKHYNPEQMADMIFKPISSYITVTDTFSQKKSLKMARLFFKNMKDNARAVMNDIYNEMYDLTHEKGYYEGCNGNPFFPLDEDDSILESLSDMLLDTEIPESKRIEINLTGKSWKQMANVQELKDLLYLLRQAQDVYFDSRFQDKENRALAELLSAYFEMMKKEKQKRGVLSYKDIKEIAFHTLSEDLAVRNYYKNKFKYIMIDEFQDNNRRDRDLLFILSEKTSLKKNTGTPSLEDIDESKLFFVGDAKQSIYKFNGADVSVFNALQEDLRKIRNDEADEAVLSMNNNYRSDRLLISHVNKVFNGVFPSPLEIENNNDKASFRLKDNFAQHQFKNFIPDSYKVEYKDIKAPLLSRITPMHPFYICDLEDRKVNPAALTAQEAQAEATVRLIRDGILNPANHDWDIPTSTGSRSPRPEDIAVLYKNTKIQTDLERRMSLLGIPYTVVASTSVTAETIASDILSFIKLVVFPKDKIAYMATLRGMFGRISDESILAMSNEFRGASYNRYELAHMAFYELRNKEEKESDLSFLASDEDRIKFTSLYKLYSKVCSMAGLVPATEIIDTLFYEGGLRTYLELSDTERGYEEHYEYIWEMARKAEDLYSFMHTLELKIEDEEKVEETVLRFEDRGVKLMTIHKSKGLGFPIVIVVDALNARDGSDNNSVSYSPDKEFAVFEKKIDDDDKAPTIKGILNHIDKVKDIEERKRLLYVAMTRAKTHLAFIGAHKKADEFEAKNKKSMSLGELYLLYSGTDPEVIPIMQRSNMLTPDNLVHADKESAFYDNEEMEISDYVKTKIGVKESGLEREPDDTPTSNSDHPYLGPFANGIDSFIFKENINSDFGTLCHETLEVKLNNLQQKEISPLPEYQGHPVTDDQKKAMEDTARELADRFIGSDFFKENVNIKTMETEKGFFYYDEESSMVLEGSVDLFIPGTKKTPNIVIDYKTDIRRNPELHRPQLSTYAKAMTMLNGIETKAYVIYLRNMDAVSI